MKKRLLYTGGSMTAFCCLYLYTTESDAKEEENDYECGKPKSKTSGNVAE